MKTKNNILTMFVTVALGLSMLAGVGLSFVSYVDAAKPQEGDPDRNLWGNEASELAQADDNDDESGSEMGEHSRSSDADPGPGRVGIGNVGDTPNNNRHPSEVVNYCAEKVDLAVLNQNQRTSRK